MVSRTSTFAPLSHERRQKAASYIIKEQGWSSLARQTDFDSVANPVEYVTSKKLESAIDDYFTYKIEYFNLYDVDLYWTDPRNWVYYADIHDEIVEDKFKIDQDVRAYITAFRMTIERNRWSIIAWKRFFQIVVTIAAFAPLLLASMRLELWASPIALGVAAILAVVVYLVQRQLWDGPLKTITSTCGTRLKEKIQLRVGNLNQTFQFYLRQIDAEEKARDMANSEWTHRSAWWMKLSMWVPKRVEYIEKFLQSEMQRTRIFMLYSGMLGRVFAEVIAWAAVFLAMVATALFHPQLVPVSWPLMLFLGLAALAAHLIGRLVIYSDSIVAAFAEGAIACAIVAVAVYGVVPDPTKSETLLSALWLILGVALTLLGARWSLLSSVSQDDVAAALTREPLGLNSRFADIRLHDEIAEQVRKDKETIRQERLRGGGIGQGGGRGN